MKQGGHNINIRNTYGELTFELKNSEDGVKNIVIKADNIIFKHQHEIATEMFALDEDALAKYCPNCETSQTVNGDGEVT